MLDISIVIPAFNEQEKIKTDIIAASRFLKDNHLQGEIIIVNDGSEDETAVSARETPVDEGVKKSVVSYAGNKGKGFAVKSGMVQSRGRYAMFADSGLCIPYNNALIGLDMIKKGGCVIAVGSRRHRQSRIKQHRHPLRKFLSVFFRNVTFSFLGIPRSFSDTQCGFKIYDGDIARELYGECQTEGFLFDIEILARALKKNYAVCEFPVEWSSDPDTRVLPHKTALPVLFELFKIKKMVR